MNKRKWESYQLLAAVNAVAVLAALVLSIASSNQAYALSRMNVIIVSCVAAVILDVAVSLAGKKLPGVCVDVICWGTTLLTTLALCTMISGRVLLMGYVYFSDLESNNPIAVAAMNLAVASWVFYALGLIANLIIGFSKKD